MLPSWMRLKADWYMDEVLREAARIEPVALVLWPILIGLAKQNSSPNNTDGVFSTSSGVLADLAMSTPERVSAALNVLAEGELILVQPGRLNTCEISVIRFAKWQTAISTRADRKARAAASPSREKALLGSEVVPSRFRGGSIDIDIDIDKDKDKEKTISSTSAEGSRPNGPDHARELFDLWITASGRNANQNRLTRQRRSRVSARLRDGYSVGQLASAIRGICSSAWHTGDNPSGKRYDTFDFIMRSGENIEKGIDYDISSANKLASATNPSGTDYEATRRFYLDQGIDENEVENLIREMQERDNGQRNTHHEHEHAN